MIGFVIVNSLFKGINFLDLDIVFCKRVIRFFDLFKCFGSYVYVVIMLGCFKLKFMIIF